MTNFLAIIGFDISQKVSAIIQEHDLYVVEYLNDNFDFAICSPRTAFRNDIVHRRKPGAFHHLAFRATSRQEVDELYLKIKAIGAEIVHPPQIFPEHGSNYYAIFFKDLDLRKPDYFLDAAGETPRKNCCKCNFKI